jgi:hypothetical protein
MRPDLLGKSIYPCHACASTATRILKEENTVLVRFLQKLLPIRFCRCVDCDERQQFHKK